MQAAVVCGTPLGGARRPAVAHSSSRRRAACSVKAAKRLDVQAVSAPIGCRELVARCWAQPPPSLPPPAARRLPTTRSALPGLQVIPMLAGDATDQTPPDLPSYLFKERIVYVVRASSGSSWGWCKGRPALPPASALLAAQMHAAAPICGCHAGATNRPHASA